MTDPTEQSEPEHPQIRLVGHANVRDSAVANLVDAARVLALAGGDAEPTPEHARMLTARAQAEATLDLADAVREAASAAVGALNDLARSLPYLLVQAVQNLDGEVSVQTPTGHRAVVSTVRPDPDAFEPEPDMPLR